MPASEPARRRRLGRKTRWTVAAGILALGAALISGYPQQRATEWAITRSTGLIADVEWGGAFPDLRIDRLYLYATPEAYKKRQPLVTALDIRTKYSSLTADRKIDHMRIGFVLIELDLDDPSLRELPFLQNDSKTDLDATFIPQQISFDGLAVKLHDTAGMFFLLDEFSVDVDLAKPESPSIAVRAADTRVVFDSNGRHLELDHVALDGAGRIEDGRLEWNQSIENAGVFSLSFDAEGPISGDDAHIKINIREGTVQGEKLAGVLESLAAPVRFSEFGIESAVARVSLDGTNAFSVSAAARIYAPRLPGGAEPLYAGAIRVSLEAEQADTFDGVVEVALAKGQRATAALSGSVDAGEARATLTGWSHDQVIDALPPAFREGLSGLDFDTFSSETKLGWTADDFEMTGRAESQGGGADAAPIFWAMQARGPRGGTQGIEGTAEARLGDRRVRASARYESADHYVAEATIEEVKIAPWVALFAGGEAAAPFGGTIEGAIRAEAMGKDAPLEIRPDLTFRNFAYDTLQLDEITAKGEIQYSSAEGRVAIAEFRVEAPDGMTHAILSGWTYDTKAQRGGGRIRAQRGPQCPRAPDKQARSHR